MADSISGMTALVTGGAKRLGGAIARRLHEAGMNVGIHYRHSEAEARALCEELNTLRPGSASTHRCDLLETARLAPMVEAVAAAHGGLHTLVNNASSFYPTAIEDVSEAQWCDLMGTNLQAPFFLAQAAQTLLAQSTGCIVNMADIYGVRPLTGYPVYCMAKAGLLMLTQALAKEMAPAVRVNAIAPGPILQPTASAGGTEHVLRPPTPMDRWGSEEEIAAAVLFLVRDASFTSGATLPVDGGRLVAAY